MRNLGREKKAQVLVFKTCYSCNKVMRSMKVSMSGNGEESKMICVKNIKNNPSQQTLARSFRGPLYSSDGSRHLLLQLVAE